MKLDVCTQRKTCCICHCAHWCEKWPSESNPKGGLFILVLGLRGQSLLWGWRCGSGACLLISWGRERRFLELSQFTSVWEPQTWDDDNLIHRLYSPNLLWKIPHRNINMNHLATRKLIIELNLHASLQKSACMFT